MDIYVCMDASEPSRYSIPPKRGSIVATNLQVPNEYMQDINFLKSAIEKQPTSEFSIEFSNMRLRGSKCKMFDDRDWVALRRLPLEPPRLESLNFKPEVIQEFQSWGSRSGLIIVGGATRAGKTTTMVGILSEYLRSHGGVAFTIEDPVEYFLQGPFGNGGYCYQHPVHEDHEWGEAVKTALRWAPRYISLGEVRTPAAAKWLLRAATSGHLAICTIHGGSIEETLSALLQIAQTELGATANSVLADGLCAVIHQSITNGRPTVDILSTTQQLSDTVRVAIRNQSLQTLGTYIEQQRTKREQKFKLSKMTENNETSNIMPNMGAKKSPISEPTRKKLLGII